jgi:gentisate 1,2-dioxygenase
LPVDYRPSSQSSPIINYPYEKSRETLEALKRGPIDPCHGIKLKYTNPATGGDVMPTLGAFIQLLPAGFRGASYRSTDATVFTVVEGRGCTIVGDKRIDWEPHDVFVVPTWALHHHEASAETVLFSFSDRPAQQRLELWREWRGAS